MTSTWTLASPTIPLLLQSRARPALLIQSTQNFAEGVCSPLMRGPAIPLAPNHSMSDISPTSSSPSLYSHAPSHTGHGHKVSTRRTQMSYESEHESLSDEEDSRRMSMVSGPKVRKYTDIPWDNIETAEERVRQSTRSSTVSPSTSTSASSTTTARRGLSNLFGTKPQHLLPSASGLSLASNQTTSTSSSDDRTEPQPLTPKLKLGAAFSENRRIEAIPRVIHVGEEDDTPLALAYSQVRGKRDIAQVAPPSLLHVRPAQPLPTDRPILTAGSPNFGLISLEAAQERERVRSGRPSQAQSSYVPRNHTRYHTEPILGQTPSTTNVPTPIDTSAVQPPSIPVPVGGPTPRIRGKKSGLMKYFNRDRADSSTASTATAGTSVRPVFVRNDSIDNKSSIVSWTENRDPGYLEGEPVQPLLPETKLKLELRPISMTFTNGLPSSYLSDQSPSPVVQQTLTDLATEDPGANMAVLFKEQIGNARKAWRVQLFELEAQIRELRDELDEARKSGHGVGSCDVCGCSCGGVVRRGKEETPAGGVMDRGRAKTAGARGVFGTGSLYEWE
jgi:hypothetical protein